jgi:hypothetical protein
MRKYFYLLIAFVFFGSGLFAQIPTGQVIRQKAGTTKKGKSIPKPEKYDADAHKWPKKDSLKNIEQRTDSMKHLPKKKGKKNLSTRPKARKQVPKK